MIKRASLNVLIVVLSLTVFVCLLELVVFRFIFIPSDLPMLSEDGGRVLKYMPNQAGVYRIRDEISAPYRINTQGWNSGHENYQTRLATEKPRICIIGDSYVEALQVAHTNSFAELLEAYLWPEVDSVYRFGLSGAPLSHYLYMLRNEVLSYAPSIVVINMVPNDFLESVQSSGGTYWSNFATLTTLDSGVISLRVPKAYIRMPSWWIKRSAVFRYLWVRQQIRPQNLKHGWMRLFEKTNLATKYSGNITRDSISDNRIPKVIDYVFSEFKNIEVEYGLKLLLVMDGRGENSPLLPLYSAVRKSAEEYGLDFLDLTEIFARDSVNNGIPRSFRYDGHWNAYAHRIVADAVGEFINEKYLIRE